jgi:DNA-binding MarR family transcriptional regulator
LTVLVDGEDPMAQRATDDAGIRLFDALVRLETDLWNAVDRDLLAAGSPGIAHLQALRIVAADAGHCRVHELREGLGISGGAASKLTDRLAASGLVARTVNPEDRRSSFIVLTDAGALALERGLSVFTAALARYLAGDASDSRRLADALTGLRVGIPTGTSHPTPQAGVL